MNNAPRTKLDLFFKAFATPDTSTREKILDQSAVDDIWYWSRTCLYKTRRDLSVQVEDRLNRNNEISSWRIRKVQIFGNTGRAVYQCRIEGDDGGYRQGEAFFEFAEDDRLKTCIDFSDPPHHVRFGGSPLLFTTAWNCKSDDERRNLVSKSWAEDGCWIEEKFERRGRSEIAAAIEESTLAEPGNHLMDVIASEDAGAQTRFQVTRKNSSSKIVGTTTYYASVDTSGRIKRLAGFEGASFLPARSQKSADPNWRWSYAAGYIDSSGQYAGGSEIMHLVGHKGKLFAANGYWEDSHWVVPKGTPKQSAQVLRLDTHDGKWEVDLDMGAESPPALNFMKGNILKSVTFTKDGNGETLGSPQNLLVMSAGTINTHVCVWVRDNSTGSWTSQTVAHGPYEKNVARKPGIKRWVPRAMELHTDAITEQERLFLLLGNPGIISGIYDPESPSKIRWDTDIEFPKNGYLDVRPLGMTEANGVLYFSGGGTIYRRIDGPKPDYAEVLTLDEKLDVEMGGIRGLTAVENPNGEGESLLFMWVPNRQSVGQIKRLDPDGEGGFTVHEEAAGSDLINALLGGDVVKRSVLGAYSEFFPLTNPENGETVHLFGLQARVKADQSLLHGGYYAGGLYAIRTAGLHYYAGEINGPFSPDKPVLKGPRTFAISPFDGESIFAGGNDTNFSPATDMAWIFSASGSTWFSSLSECPPASHQ